MNFLEYAFIVLMGIFIQNALYDIKKHVKQSEQYLSWIQEDIQAIRKVATKEDEQK